MEAGQNLELEIQINPYLTCILYNLKCIAQTEKCMLEEM